MRSPRSSIGLIALLAVLSGACGSDGPVESADTSTTGEPASSTTTPTSVATTSGQTGSSTSAAATPDPLVRQFQIEGVAVSTRTALDDLPEVAALVQFTTTVIDSGDGPELCLGGVADSLPPQCAGPIVSGLDMTPEWAETQSGVSWGDRTVVVRWPPADGHLELVSDEPPVWPPPSDRQPPTVPEECADITTFVPMENLQAWAVANPERVGIGFVFPTDSGQQGGYQVVGDIDAARAELRDGTAEACLVPARFAQGELTDAQRRMHETAPPELYLVSSGSGSLSNRIDANVAVADQRTVRGVIELLDDPSMLTIAGAGVILG